jgi:hypothetical protein
MNQCFLSSEFYVLFALQDLFVRTEMDLMEILETTESAVDLLVATVSHTIAGQPKTVSQLLNESQSLSVFLFSLLFLLLLTLFLINLQKLTSTLILDLMRYEFRLGYWKSLGLLVYVVVGQMIIRLRLSFVVCFFTSIPFADRQNSTGDAALCLVFPSD